MSIWKTCFLVTPIIPRYENTTEILTSCLSQYVYEKSILTLK